MSDCNVCGAPNAPHSHVPDIDAAIAGAPASAWTETVVDGETRNFRVRLPDDAVQHICDRCAPAYALAHPDFRRRP
jgi:hypothetical protein